MHTHIIAEMACSHDGSAELGRQIIASAAAAGADAVQFQVWAIKDMMVPHHPDFERVAKIELSRDEWRALAEFSREQAPEMQIIACVYERASADFALQIGADAFKLHSSDLSNPFLVKHVAGMGKRIDLSVGASTLDEIETALEWIRAAGNEDVWLMYGYQSFPTPTDQIHLAYMRKLRELFELPVGYQDHTDADKPDAFYLPAAAVGLGVDVLEKHITHDRSKKGIDHEAALNGDEFAEFVRMVRELERAMGSAVPKPFTDEEIKYRRYSKKSLVAARDLPAGTTIQREDLTFMRADDLGVPPDQWQALAGRKTRRDIDRFHLVRRDDVE